MIIMRHSVCMCVCIIYTHSHWRAYLPMLSAALQKKNRVEWMYMVRVFNCINRKPTISNVNVCVWEFRFMFNCGILNPLAIFMSHRLTCLMKMWEKNHKLETDSRTQTDRQCNSRSNNGNMVKTEQSYCHIKWQTCPL